MTIKVDYQVSASSYGIAKKLKQLSNTPKLSFDTETSGLYNKQEREYAKSLLKNTEKLTKEQLAECRMVAKNDGLSFPSQVRTTHFIFGLSKSQSEILIPSNYRDELVIWEWLKTCESKIFIHNALFDLKIMINRVGALPPDFEDTSLLAKTYLNHVDVWKAKTGLKELMGAYYDPTWVLMKNYEPDNPKEPRFLRYAAIDGAATYYLSEMLEEHKQERGY